MTALKSDSEAPHLHIVDDQIFDKTENACKVLIELSRRMDRRHNFRKGQLAEWKAGLKNRSSPFGARGPMVVREVLSSPVYDKSELSAGSVYFGEPLTIIVGIVEDSDLVELRVDGRRLQPFTGKRT